ncbi:MAG: hypothetical protein Q4A32_04395 [Lachnospiraceae bacterium]|nr:hypothetical protein [Lachnospiraceae bacterium]
MKTQNRISYVSSDIDKRHKEGLDAVGFHEAEDRVFLGCAYNADKYLVTEDSDYGVSPVANKNDELALRKKRYIETEMGVELADSARALKDSLARLK